MELGVFGMVLTFIFSYNRKQNFERAIYEFAENTRDFSHVDESLACICSKAYHLKEVKNNGNYKQGVQV